MANNSTALVHTFRGHEYRVPVRSVLWESYKCDREAGLPTPWEVLTESVSDLIADVLLSQTPELFYDATTVAESWERVYDVAEPMAQEWVRRFGVCR